ncbi:phospholipase A [Noviherbaspirillum sp.]|uniref:phospholipase A n=1 Tax=Noviherbaspirillum sp. TaxID=1926288 RepID=UPI002D4AD082|nr:phospholipase A [Noviherbaspirillum sp.]HZW20736.1 phospholipase A [Noviherbaspirillum sp.]
MKNKRAAAGVLTGLLAVAFNATAQAIPSTVDACKALDVDMERLACYDRISGRNAPPAPDVIVQPDMPAPAAPPARSSSMAEHWELDPASKKGTFNFRPHRENYMVATYNHHPHEEPYRPFRQIDPNADLAHGELAFQLGFKLKVAENPGNLPVDLWFGYTQRSFWQAGNREASSPFRESNYEPELMAVVPANLDLLGLKLRFVNLGLVHQSNGGGSTLSRSWNRAYLQAGLERGDFQLLARVWKRINEDREEDDNPRIADYMGHGDLLGSYRWHGHEFSLLTRYNFNTDKGAAQLGWAFPLTSRLKGYVQYFSGYGYSLIDYDAYQRVLGLGVLVTY